MSDESQNDGANGQPPEEKRPSESADNNNNDKDNENTPRADSIPKAESIDKDKENEDKPRTSIPKDQNDTEQPIVDNASKDKVDNDQSKADKQDNKTDNDKKMNEKDKTDGDNKDEEQDKQNWCQYLWQVARSLILFCCGTKLACELTGCILVPALEKIR